MDNVTPIRGEPSKVIRQYDHTDGGYILISEHEFSLMSEKGKSEYKLNARVPTLQEIEEFKKYQKFHSLWQSVVNRLEETSSGRPAVFTKKGHPIKWRYSTHDIANILTWTAVASQDRIHALEKEIEELKQKLKGE